MLSLFHRVSDHDVRPEQPYFVVSASQRYYARDISNISNTGLSHFYSFQVAETAALTLAIPDGCTDILFDCHNTHPLARVCGTTLKAKSVELKRGHHYFGVRFMPGVMPDFLDLTAKDLPDREFNFLDVAPDTRETFEKIIGSTHFEQQITLFRDRFAPNRMRRPSLVTQFIIQSIQQKKGNIRLDELERTTGYTSRSIQRLFRQDTGMTPKYFCRIMRFQSAINAINCAREGSFSTLALDLGYSDQSHFLREFKQLINATPGDYQRHITRDGYTHRIHFC